MFGNYLVCVIEKVLCNLKGFVFNICLKIVGSALGKNLLLQIFDLRWERSCVRKSLDLRWEGSCVWKSLYLRFERISV